MQTSQMRLPVRRKRNSGFVHDISGTGWLCSPYGFSLCGLCYRGGNCCSVPDRADSSLDFAGPVYSEGERVSCTTLSESRSQSERRPPKDDESRAVPRLDSACMSVVRVCVRCEGKEGTRSRVCLEAIPESWRGHQEPQTSERTSAKSKSRDHGYPRKYH